MDRIWGSAPITSLHAWSAQGDPARRHGGAAQRGGGAVAAAPPATGPVDATAQRPGGVHAAPLRLLYIEDNPVNTILVQELIKMRPALQLACAETGERGVAMARAERPEIVLIDMHLPDFDGGEVLRRLQGDRALDGQVRIALSANTLPRDIARARAAGFDDYWTKPLDFQHFLAGIDALASRLRVDQ